MSPAEYLEFVRETAIYPRQYAVIYPSLGLVGEVGELANKVKKVIRDNHGDVRRFRNDLKAELGDCLWYYFALMDDLGKALPAEWADEWVRALPGGDNLIDKIIMVSHWASLLAYEPSDPDAADICIMDMEYVAYHLNTTLGDIADLNAAKLRSRQERGVLQGSGDNR